MPFYPLDLPPGLYKNGTDYQSQGRWHTANLMRWIDRTMRPVGGWVKAVPTELDGPGRGMNSWRAFNNIRWAGIGTPNKLWAFDDDQLHDITPTTYNAPGNVDTIYGIGYGFGDYGAGPFGISGAGGKSDATTWSLDNFGQYLVGMATSDGFLYLWQLDTTMPAVKVATAPTGVSCFVTAEGFVVVLGANGSLNTAAWCDQQNIAVWTALSTNQAGDYPFTTDGILLKGVRVRGSSLILTTTDAWTMTYIGPQAVYSFAQVGVSCGLIGPLALVPFLGGAAWPGANGFYAFDGTSVRSVPCDVNDYVFGDINRLQLAKVSGRHVSIYSEIWWHYPSAASTENDRYVVWNYREDHWSCGTLTRTCGVDQGAFLTPLAVSPSGALYRHESGDTDDGTSRVGQIFAASGPVEIGNGDSVYTVTQLIPDEVTGGQVNLTLAAKFSPEDVEWDFGPVPLTPLTDVRFTGRQMAVKFTNTVDADFRIGRMRLEAKAGSGR